MQLFRVDRLLRNTQILGDVPDYHSLLISTIHIAWPSILESFLIALVAMVDTIMVGTIGSQAIASVGLTTQPKFIGLAVFISLNVAISAIVARRRGEGDRADANRVLMQALLLTLLLTAVVSTISILFANQIIRFAGSHPETHADAVAYFRIIMGGLICNTISMVINAAQRGSGNTKIAMRTNLVSNSVNVVFNYLLIGGKLGFPRLGVTGAAIATVIGSACACGMSIRSLLHPDHFIFLHGVQHARFERKTLSAIFNIGSSTLAEQIFMRVGFLTYSILVAKLGTIAFATHQIGVNLLTLSFSFGDGLSVAAIAMVGRSLGEQRPDMARLYGASGLRPSSRPGWRSSSFRSAGRFSCSFRVTPRSCNTAARSPCFCQSSPSCKSRQWSLRAACAVRGIRSMPRLSRLSASPFCARFLDGCSVIRWAWA